MYVFVECHELFYLLLCCSLLFTWWCQLVCMPDVRMTWSHFESSQSHPHDTGWQSYHRCRYRSDARHRCDETRDARVVEYVEPYDSWVHGPNPVSNKPRDSDTSYHPPSITSHRHDDERRYWEGERSHPSSRDEKRLVKQKRMGQAKHTNESRQSYWEMRMIPKLIQPTCPIYMQLQFMCLWCLVGDTDFELVQLPFDFFHSPQSDKWMLSVLDN